MVAWNALFPRSMNKKPSSKVQEVLAIALFALSRSPNLSPEDAEWVRQYALRTITEFRISKSQKEEADASEERIAA